MVARPAPWRGEGSTKSKHKIMDRSPVGTAQTCDCIVPTGLAAVVSLAFPTLKRGATNAAPPARGDSRRLVDRLTRGYLPYRPLSLH